jgi:F-type H+-transporting ATPase subunit b
MEGIAKLGINLPGLLAQLISFGVLFTLLYIVAYKPLMRKFDERAKHIKESMEQADHVKDQALHAEEELKKQIEVGRKEGQEIVNRAARSGEEIQAKAREDAKSQAEAIITKAKADIQRERDEAIRDIRSEFVDLTITAAEKVIDKSLDKNEHRDLIDKVLEQSKPKQG